MKRPLLLDLDLDFLWNQVVLRKIENVIQGETEC